MIVSRRLLLAGAPALLGCGRVNAAPPASEDRWAEVDRLCREVIERRRAPGLSIAVTRAGRLEFARAYGAADVPAGRPVLPATAFRIASVTKPLIGVLFLLLRREGKLGLDDPVARWTPEFPRAREITLRMLLTHTSGLGEYTRIPLEALIRDAAVDYTPERLVARMAATRPLFAHPPGTRWAYSNTGYVLLGVIAERAGGTPLGELLRQRVTGPAGLAATAWDGGAFTERATGHAWRSGGWRPIPYVSASFVGASGAVRSTAADLCRWSEALAAGRMLTAVEFAEFTTPARPTQQRDPPPYGLGVFTGQARGRRVLFHQGSTAGFAADWRCYPAERMGLAILINADAGRIGRAPGEIRGAVLDATFGPERD